MIFKTSPVQGKKKKECASVKDSLFTSKEHINNSDRNHWKLSKMSHQNDVVNLH